jgi:hypothetical protein
MPDTGPEPAKILTSSNRKGDVAKVDRNSGESQYLSAEGEQRLNKRPRPESDYKDKKNMRNRVKVKVKLVPLLS